MPKSTNKGVDSNELYNYSIVLFVHRGRRRQIEKIHIVPTKWLSLNNNKLLTSFLSEPIQGEDITLLKDLTKNNADAPADWSLFHVKIVGRADSYTEACTKLENLQTDKTALLCDSGQDVEVRMMDALKQRDLLKTQAALCKKMNDTLLPSVVPTEPLPIKSSAERHITVSNSLPPGAAVMESLLNESTAKDHTTKTDGLLSEVVTSNPLDSESIVKEQIPKCASSSNKQELDIIHVPEVFYTSTSTLKNETVQHGFFNEEEHHIGELLSPTDINVSVLEITSSYECKNDFERAVMGEFLQLRAELSQLSQRLERIEKYLIDKKIVGIANKKINFKEKYHMNIPLNTINEFTNFNSDLESNTLFKQDVLTELRSLLNSDGSITKSYVNMLKKFVTKALAQHFTASRKSADTNNIILKTTEFCRCMDSLIINKRKKANSETEEKDLISGLSDVLSNVRNWKDPV